MKKGKGAKIKANWQNIERSKKIGLVVGVAAVFAFVAIGGIKLLKNGQNNQTGVPSTKAESCTIDAKLVNSCRPWLSASSAGYTMAGSNSITNQINFFEKRLNNPNVLNDPNAATTVTKKLDIVHTYHSPGKNVLTAEEIAFVNRPNTILQTNWKPAETWASAAGGNATVNGTIDQMANSIKSVSPKKVMLAVYHEPEDNVTTGSAGSCATKSTGSNGSPTDYVNMWHNVRARFDAAGVTNVVWNMNYMGFSNWHCLDLLLYPGDNYVDWITWDPYANGTQTFDSSVKIFYDFLTQNSNTSRNFLSKPWGLSEFGYWNNVGNSTEAQAPIYWQQAKTSITTNKWPKIKLYSAFDNNLDAGGAYTSSSMIGLQFNTTILPSIPEQTAFNAFADAIFALGGGTAPPATDTTAPVVTISSPPASSIVKGTISTTATASDAVGVTKAELNINNVLKQTITGAGPFSSAVDTSTYANGSTVTFNWKAYDAAGNVGSSGAVVTVNNTVADTTPPSTPTNLVSTAQTTDSISLSWATSTDSVGVTSYKMYRNGVQVGTTSAAATTTFVNTGLLANTAYSYAVAAVDAAGNESVKSSALTVSTKPLPDTTAPTAPTGVTATANSPTSVTVKWAAATDNVGVTQYLVQRDGVTIAQLSQANLSYTDSAVSASTQYSYVVRAVDLAGNVSSASSPAVVKTPSPPDTTAPSVPTSLTTSLVTSTQVNLIWAASTDNIGVVGYKISRDSAQITTSQTTSLGDATVQPSTAYVYSVVAYDAAGNTSTAATISVTTPATPIAVPNGLKASYFNNITLTGAPTLTRTDQTVNFDWASRSPDPSINSNNFSARWEGSVSPASTGNHMFYTTSDDGVRLWVNDQLIIDNWTDHGAKENTATIALVAGVKYDIKMEYYEKSGLSVAKLLWSGPGATKVIVPSSALTTDMSGLTAAYYATNNLSGTPTLIRTDQTVNFDWASGSPDPSIPVDNYSVSWTGNVTVPTSGTYTFYTNSDDGVRLWVNGQQVINNWSDHGVREDFGTIALVAGVKYDIKMEYYEKAGLSVAKLLWSGPGVSKAPVPSNVLRNK